ncbi:MAG: DUF2304 domain-containing protein [Thermodesulfobacteriota bacterium]
MPVRQQIFSLIVGITVAIFILEMVRRRKLREEYSWLWFLTALGIVVLAIWYDFLVMLSHLIGAVLPTTTLFILGLLFLLLITLQCSIKISALTDKINRLTQEVAILKAELERPGGKDSE